MKSSNQKLLMEQAKAIDIKVKEIISKMPKYLWD